jgi:hypothetical protein
MGGAIGEVLGSAVGVAISPVPIIALILMLFSRAAVRNSVAFLVGWLLGLTGISVGVLVIGLEGGGGGEAGGAGVVKILVGVVFLVLAVKQWRGRPAEGAEPQLPPWMATIGELSASAAFGLGLLLTVANPKNLGLAIVAATKIGAADLTPAEELLTVLVFVLLASVSVIAPVGARFVARDRTDRALDTAKTWLVGHRASVMTVLLLVLGASVLGDGIAAIT